MERSRPYADASGFDQPPVQIAVVGTQVEEAVAGIGKEDGLLASRLPRRNASSITARMA
jgi:hypothetical protein